MISNELRTEMREIKNKLPGQEMPRGIAELPTGVKATSFLALSKLNSNTLMQRAESKKLDRETFRLLLIYKLTPYFGFIPLALANISPTESQVWPVVNRIYGKDTPTNPVGFKSLHSSYKSLKQTIKSEKEVKIGSDDVLLTDTFKNFKKQIVENMKTGIQILDERSEKLDQQKSQELKECIGTLKNDFIRSRDKGIKSVFYALKLFKNTIPVSPSQFIEKKYLDLFAQTLKLKKLLDEITKSDSQNSAANGEENPHSPDNRVEKKDNAGNLSTRRRRGFSLGSAINRLANAGNDSSTGRKRSLSLDLTLDKSPNTADDTTTARKRSRSLGSAFSRLGNTVMGRRHRSVSLDDSAVGKSEPSEADLENFTELVGDIANKLVQENQGKYAVLLNKDVRNVLGGNRSTLHKVLETLEQEKNIALVSVKNGKCKIELPAKFDDFKTALGEAKTKAEATKSALQEAYLEALKSICSTVNNWDPDALPVKSLYDEIIPDDPNIKTCNHILDRSKYVLEASDDTYKHAFYAMKLFKNNTIDQGKLPNSECGLNSNILDSFRILEELKKLNGPVKLDEATVSKLREGIEQLPPPSIGNFVGNTIGKINNKKPDLLNDDVRKFFKGRSSDLEHVLETTLKKRKNLHLVVERKDAQTKETQNFTYEIELPATFEEFQDAYRKTLNEAKGLINKINIDGKKVRDEFLENTCKSNGIDAHDKLVQQRVDSIYSEVIADDPTITTGKRLSQITKDPDGILKDSKGMYKHAFYTLKLFREGDIRELDIPMGCGITSTIGAFKLPLEFKLIVAEGTIAEDYSFSEKTKDELRKKIAKLRGETTKPLDAPAPSLDEFVVDTGSASGMDLGDSANVSTLPHIKQPDAPTPSLDELIGDSGPEPKMDPVVKVGPSAPPSHLPPEAIKPLDASTPEDAVVLPGETPIK